MSNNDNIFSTTPTAEQLRERGYCIDPEKLQDLLSVPEFHQVLTGEYAGHYTAGVRKFDNADVFLIRYQIEGEFPTRRDEIVYNDMTVIVQTEGGFKPPQALSQSSN